MTAFNVDLALEQGASYATTFVWARHGVPVDLTACAARLQVRSSYDSDVVLLDLTDANGGLVLGAEDGSIGVRVSAEQSAAFDWRSGVHDVEIYQPPLFRTRRLMAGSVTVAPNVTR